MRALKVLLFLFWLAPLAVLAETPPLTLERELSEITQRAITEHRVAGSVVIVYHKGRPVFEQAAGLSDIEMSKPMQVDSLYHVLGVSDGLDQPTLSTEENLHRLAKAPLKFAPGTAFLYGLSTDVLGAAIAKAQNRPLPQALETLVLKPLGMKDT